MSNEMKWIKVEVPNDFDPQTDKIIPEYRRDSDDHHEISATGHHLRVWEPITVPVLDHGFCRLVDHMASDAAIVRAARVSYGQGTKTVNEDRGLIRYMMRHHHTTPFESCEFQFHIKAPIFVFRQWHRTRTATINEISGRYSVLPEETYLPDRPHMAVQSTTNRQGRGEGLNDSDFNACMAAIDESLDLAFRTYSYLLGENPNPPENINRRKLWLEESAVNAITKMRREQPDRTFTVDDLNEKIQEYYRANGLNILPEGFAGLSRELARIVLPLATYSEMYWKIDLHNLFHFLRLRLDHHAQYEIQVYAEAILGQIRPLVPLAVEAFTDYILNACTFSWMEMEAIQATLRDVEDTLVASKLSGRELEEFRKKLDPCGS